MYEVMILFLLGIYINIRVHTYLRYNELSINECVLIVSQDCLYNIHALRAVWVYEYTQWRIYLCGAAIS